MIILGVDLGERRIGIAVSDPLGVAARPLYAIEHESLANDVARVLDLAQKHKAQRIVVGLPLNMDGSLGPAARRARRFASALRRKSKMDVVWWDERLSTFEAEQVIAGASGTIEESRESVDQLAAAVILQDYLNARRGSEEGECDCQTCE